MYYVCYTSGAILFAMNTVVSLQGYAVGAGCGWHSGWLWWVVLGLGGRLRLGLGVGPLPHTSPPKGQGRENR